MASSMIIFDTHPIQYRSPVFRDLAQKLPGVKVYFFSETFDGGKWWFHEVGKIPKQRFGLPLTEGFPSQILGTSQYGLRERYRMLKEILDRESPDAVLIYGYFLPEHWMLRLLCRKLRIPLVFVGETFGHQTSLWRKALKLPLLKYFFTGVSEFIAIGNKTAQYYRGWNVPKSKITSAKYCVDTTFFELPVHKAMASRITVREKLGIPKDAFINLFVGRLFERKRPFDVIELHKHFLGRPNFYTLFVGNGPMEEEIAEKIKDLPRFLMLGFKNQLEIRDLYYAADTLFVPSEYETWGLVVNEAFACGLPALVSQTCGVAGDLVINDSTGGTFTVGNIDKAAEILSEWMRDPNLLNALGENARQKVLSEYRPDQFSDAILKALSKLVPAH
jgi:glycosyltransferase involved in cell wall biosynthesis